MRKSGYYLHCKHKGSPKRRAQVVWSETRQMEVGDFYFLFWIKSGAGFLSGLFICGVKGEGATMMLESC